TKPPARFTEASLVKNLEAEGVGRPSTYASIIDTIQNRGYVEKQGSQLVPSFTAVAVNTLLEKNFSDLVDYKFTAEMEQKLDDIARGKQDRLPYLNRFYAGDAGLDTQVKTNEEKIDPRQACTVSIDGIGRDVRIGKYGPFFEAGEGEERVTASIPVGVAPADLSDEVAEKLIKEKKEGPTALGEHPETGEPIYVKNGPYGTYVQLGDVTDEKPKPKRTSVPKFLNPSELTFQDALDLLALPRRIGHHPVTGKVVNTGVGMYGPYVLHDKKYGSFDKKTHKYEFEGREYTVLDVTMDAAVDMLSKVKPKSAPEPLRVVGEHPDDGKPIGIYDGRYGAYVKHGKINATLPKGTDIKTVTKEQALTLLAEKAAKGGGVKKKAAKKKSAKKKAAKKKS
ncbi:MAG: topoisomerase C-terminal repeat-containing protein, partial [Planctomycetota bacterium]